MPVDFSTRRRMERQSATSLADWQLERLNSLLRRVLPHNRFYEAKLAGVDIPIRALDELRDWPLTTKEELVSGPEVLGYDHAAHPNGAADLGPESELARNLTYPLERYVRYHRTSGTRGRPLVVLDTAEDWQWWIDSWQYVLDAARITAADRVLLAFSFGPFIGFWSAFDAVAQRGALVVPTGGMSTAARLDAVRSTHATAVFCTPSYALRMAEVASERKLDLTSQGVRTILVAGEPGGSVPATRRRIERAWGRASSTTRGPAKSAPGASRPPTTRVCTSTKPR